MALKDIIDRIEHDAAQEAARLIETAESRATAIRAEAQAKAAESTARTIAEAERVAARDAETLVVNARLVVRDARLSGRRAALEQAYARTEQALAELPDEEYARLLASRIVASARGGERVLFGEADKGRIAAVVSAVAALDPAVSLDVSDESAPFAHGVLMLGDRVRTDLSLTAIVDERRDQLEALLVDALFEEAD